MQPTLLPVVCTYRPRPAHALRAHPAHLHTPPPLPRSWFLVLPAAVGFAAVLLLLLYSACLIETVDDEVLLGLLTTLPTMAIYVLWPRILWPCTYYGCACCRRCSASSGAASGSTRHRYRASPAISPTISRRTAPSRIRSRKRWCVAPRRPAPQPRRSHARHPPPSHTGGLPQDHRRRGARGAGTAAACAGLQPARHASWDPFIHICIHTCISRAGGAQAGNQPDRQQAVRLRHGCRARARLRHCLPQGLQALVTGESTQSLASNE